MQRKSTRVRARANLPLNLEPFARPDSPSTPSTYINTDIGVATRMEQLRIFLLDHHTMAASSPSSTVIQVDHASSTNGEATPTAAAAAAAALTTTPKGEADPTTAPPAAPAAATATDKVMSSAANLAQLLPTGSVLAYQALSPSFTNRGDCAGSNQWLTAALVAVLALFSLFFSFTDSVLGRDGKLYYGVATPGGFNVFNFSSDEEKREWGPEEFARLRLRPLDFMHAFFTAVVFLVVAFSDVALQNCFFGRNPGRNTEELLKNLPLGMAFLSSFVFMIFPTKRKGIGYNDTTPRPKTS